MHGKEWWVWYISFHILGRQAYIGLDIVIKLITWIGFYHQPFDQNVVWGEGEHTFLVVNESDNWFLELWDMEDIRSMNFFEREYVITCIMISVHM